jgi:Flp pilus assembly protein TadG
MVGTLRRFLCGAQSGVAALEFALVLPFLIILYLGTAEVSIALMASRKLSLSTAAMAELTSFSGTINAATAANILEASRAMLEPFDATSLTQRVSALVVDADGVARVAWSVGAGIEGLAAGTAVDVPADLRVPDEGLVMAEAQLDYVSPMAFTMPGLRQFSELHFIYPRLDDRVLWESAS